jgi:hypothetical protein
MLVAAIAMTCAMAGPVMNSKDFELPLPPGIEAARRVVIELSDVRLPRNAAVVFRARVIEEDGAEVALGSVGFLAESNEAQGTVLHPAMRIDVTKALKRWCQAHPEMVAVRVRVAPFAGKEPLADLEWSAGSAELKVMAP